MKLINDRKLWENKVKEAIKSFSFIQKELDNSIDCMIVKIRNVEMQVKELTKALELMNQTNDINLSLFSPYENTHKNSEVKRLRAELHALNENLPKLVQELSGLQAKRDKENMIKECLDYMQILVEENTFASGKKNINDAPNMENKGGNFLSSIELDSNGIKILETKELERQRIARDLHDSTIQNLTNLVHKTELCLKLFDIDTVRAKLEMKAMIESTRLIINSMREIIYNLRPMSIQDLGLIPTIELFIKKYKKEKHLQVLFTYQEERLIIHPIINLSIYRIIQEACNNIAKYAQATICKILINYEENQVKLIIEDNGKGMEEEEKFSIDNENCGFGLSIMRERALLLSGDFIIETNKGKGTKIIVTIPYQEHRGD